MHGKTTAEQGHADAQVNLGTMYHNGEGVEKNKTKAMLWFPILDIPRS